MFLESVVFSIIVNNEEVGPTHPSRGSRQGNPLSLYLFLLCVEGLLTLIKLTKAWGKIHDVKISRSALSISHLFFTDD